MHLELYSQPGHSMDNLTIMCIEKIRKNDPHLRGRRESYWIYTLHTLAPADESFDI